GRDILGKAPTGSGKTLAFALPIVELVSAGEPAPAALVLAPTRELALQVTEELTLVGKLKGIRAAAAYGGAPVGQQVERLRGAPRRRTRPSRHDQSVAVRGRAALAPCRRRRRARVRGGHRRQQARAADRRARRGAGARPRLRAHEARRRPARPQTVRARSRSG